MGSEARDVKVRSLTDSGLTDFDLYLFGEGRSQGYPYSLRLNLPPLGAMFLIGPA
jgi:hypothetical protein